MPVKLQYRTLDATKKWDAPPVKGRSTLQWLGPTLVRAGLVKNEPWVEEHAAIAESYYSEMKPQAVAIAICHPLALQYLQQAPVLVLSHMRSSPIVNSGEYEASSLIETAHRFQGLASQRPKLRNLMAEFKIPYVLRDFSCPNILSEDIHTVDHLYRGIQEGYIRASTVRQSFEAGGRRHTQWLFATNAFTTTLGWHPSEHFFSYLNWHLKSWGQPNYDGPPGVGHVADFIDANPRLFNPTWTVKRILAEAQNWLNQLHVALSTPTEELLPIDYFPWPNEPTKVGEYTFVPLRSPPTLALEGRMMHHCVASYARRVHAGQCKIYSIRRDPYVLPLATVEFRPSGRVSQIKGMYNAAPPPEILAPMIEFQRICEECERNGNGVVSV